MPFVDLIMTPLITGQATPPVCKLKGLTGGALKALINSHRLTPYQPAAIQAGTGWGLQCRPLPASFLRSSDSKEPGVTAHDGAGLDFTGFLPLIESFANKATQLVLTEAQHSLLPDLLNGIDERQAHKLQQLETDYHEAMRLKVDALTAEHQQALSAAHCQHQAAQAALQASLQALQAEHEAALRKLRGQSTAAEAQRAQLQQRLEDKTQQLKICHIELTEAQEEIDVLRCQGKELLTFQGSAKLREVNQLALLHAVLSELSRLVFTEFRASQLLVNSTFMATGTAYEDDLRLLLLIEHKKAMFWLNASVDASAMLAQAGGAAAVFCQEPAVVQLTERVEHLPDFRRGSGSAAPGCGVVQQVPFKVLRKARMCVVQAQRR
eukprot:gene11135-11288_t